MTTGPQRSHDRRPYDSRPCDGRSRAPWGWALLIAWTALVALTSWPGRAAACAPCGAGDVVARIAGAEQPFRGRARIAVVGVHTSYADSEAHVDEQRLLLGGSVAVDDVTLLTAALPLVWREVRDAALAHDTSVSVGDLDLRLRSTLWRDRSFAPAHRLVLELGTRLPTAPLLRRPAGSIAPLDVQTGTGAFEPLVGLSWLATFDDTSLTLGVQGAFPMTGYEGWRNGAALRTSLAVQWQPLPELALRGTLDTRLEEAARGVGQREQGETFLLHLGGGLVVVPHPDVVLHLGVRVPVLGLYGATRWDGLTFEGGLALDV